MFETTNQFYGNNLGFKGLYSFFVVFRCFNAISGVYFKGRPTEHVN